MAAQNETTVSSCEFNNSCPTATVSPNYFQGVCANSYCIPMVVCISVVSIVGLFANGITLFVIGYNRKLHRPTFTAIAALSLCDFTFLFFRYSRYIIHGYFGKSMGMETYIIVRLVCDSAGIVAGAASVITIVLLSVMRYVMVVHPLWSHVNITNKKVMLISGTVWFVGCLISALYMYTVVIHGKHDQKTAKVVNITVTLVMSILPLVIIIVLHVFKARTLRASLAACRRNTTKQMSRIVTIVIVSYIVTTTPANARDVLIIAGYNRFQLWMIIYGHIGRLMLFLNYTINPFIYFVHSQQFKKYANCFRRKSARESTNASTSLDSSKTYSTSVSHSNGRTNHIHKEPVTTLTDTDVSDNESIVGCRL